MYPSNLANLICGTGRLVSSVVTRLAAIAISPHWFQIHVRYADFPMSGFSEISMQWEKANRGSGGR